MKVLLMLCILYQLQAQNKTLQASAVVTTATFRPNPPTTNPTSPTSPSKPIDMNSKVTDQNVNLAVPFSIVMPVKIPSPIYDSLYYQYHSPITPYHVLIFSKQSCKSSNVIKKFAIKQHNTSYYLTSEKYFVSFKNTSSNLIQFFTATQNSDCTWSIMSKEGYFISLKPDYTYLMLQPKITSTQKFFFVQKNDYLYIQSAANTIYYWTTINGIGRLGKKQGSRFSIEIW